MTRDRRTEGQMDGQAKNNIAPPTFVGGPLITSVNLPHHNQIAIILVFGNIYHKLCLNHMFLSVEPHFLSPKSVFELCLEHLKLPAKRTN